MCMLPREIGLLSFSGVFTWSYHCLKQCPGVPILFWTGLSEQLWKLWSALILLYLLIIFPKSLNSVKMAYLFPPCIFFLLFSTGFGHLSPLGSPQLVSRGIAISMTLSLFNYTWNQTSCIWGLLTSSGLKRWVFLFFFLFVPGYFSPGVWAQFCQQYLQVSDYSVSFAPFTCSGFLWY